MIIEMTIGSKQIILECDAELKPLAEEVVRKLESAHKQGTPMVEGTRIQLGWSVLTLRAEDSRLRVCEPAFRTNPFEQLEPTLNITLRVLASQIRVLRRVGEAGVDVTYDQLVLIVTGVLEREPIYLKRLDPRSKQDSGWFIGDLDHIEDPNETQTQALAAFELFRIRLAVLQVLALPSGYIVTMSGDAILQVFDTEGRDRWGATGA